MLSADNGGIEVIAIMTEMYNRIDVFIKSSGFTWFFNNGLILAWMKVHIYVCPHRQARSNQIKWIRAKFHSELNFQLFAPHGRINQPH